MVTHQFHSHVLPGIASVSRRMMLYRLGQAGFVVAAAAVSPELARAQTPAASSGSMAPITEAWTAAWNSHDSAQVAALFTPDGLYEDLAFGFVAHGTDEITNFAQGFFTGAP